MPSIIVARQSLDPASKIEPSPFLILAGVLHQLALGAWIGGVIYFIASLRIFRAASRRSYGSDR